MVQVPGKQSLRWNLAFRKFIRAVPWDQHTWGKERKQDLAEREKMGCNVLITNPMPTPWGAVKLQWPFRVVLNVVLGGWVISTYQPVIRYRHLPAPLKKAMP